MSRLGRARPTASLFVRLLTFMGLTLLAAQAASLFIVFKLPPPMSDFYWVREIEQALRGETLSFSERAPLVTRVGDRPEPDLNGPAVPAARARLARDLGVPVENVAIAGDPGPLSDRRVIRVTFSRGPHELFREQQFFIAPFQVGVRLSDGRWRVVEPRRALGPSAWEKRVLLWFALSTLAMSPVAYAFARQLSAPTRMLTDAALRLGRDPRAPPLEVKGSADVAVAAAAFNEMQARLSRYVEFRASAVGGLAHDLRTPLTRLRFRIECAPEEQRAKMATDIEQMEEMIAVTLAFVRDTSRPAERTPLELSSLLETLCDEMAETGADTVVERREKVIVEGDPMALRRLFSNLLENAVKYGRCARVRVFLEEAHAVVEVDDDGPGIPDDEIERVFEPFYRREPSRSRQTGGIGLGLAKVRSIARLHGGDATLMNRPAGGLTARVELPL